MSASMSRILLAMWQLYMLGNEKHIGVMDFSPNFVPLIASTTSLEPTRIELYYPHPDLNAKNISRRSKIPLQNLQKSRKLLPSGFQNSL